MTQTKVKTKLTFNGDSAVKDKYLARLRAHAAADEIIKGVYWEKGKGCAVGCTIHSDHHFAYEEEICPAWLAFLEDHIFENLPNKDAKEWPIQFIEAIPIGVPFDKFEAVKRRFLAWVLIDETDGLFSKVEDAEIKPLIGTIGRLLSLETERPLNEGEVAEGARAARAARAAWAARDARAAWDA